MEEVIRTEEICFVYQKGTPFEFQALKDISLTIYGGEYVGIIGPTGSGKSTLIQQFNGLLKPDSGSVYVNGRNINEKGADRDPCLCFKVGLVFQYPEYQLFEETVYDDIAFGPRNMELSEVEVEERVRNAMDSMGLDYGRYARRLPFGLSGGEMRRVALAGVLAMRPSVLVLDEPMAGLDPRARVELRNLLKSLHMDLGITVIIVTHDMNEITPMMNRLIIMNNGEMVGNGAPRVILEEHEWLGQIGLGIPPFMELMLKLKKRGIQVDTGVLDLNGAVEEIMKHIGNKMAQKK